MVTPGVGRGTVKQGGGEWGRVPWSRTSMIASLEVAGFWAWARRREERRSREMRGSVATVSILFGGGEKGEVVREGLYVVVIELRLFDL